MNIPFYVHIHHSISFLHTVLFYIIIIIIIIHSVPEWGFEGLK